MRWFENNRLGPPFVAGGISVLLVLVLLVAEPGLSQEAPFLSPPPDLDVMVQQMQFDTPTRIAGRFLSFDPYDDAIWIEWTEVHNGRRWLPVPPERQFIVYPRDGGMMDFFRHLSPGVVLRMTVQTDHEGKRRVLALEGT